jgi:protein ImuB
VNCDHGLATMALLDNARRLAAVDDEAAACGAARGQTVADAIALVASLKIVEAEPEEDLRALKRLADWCVRFSPAAAVDPPDGLFLSIEGCAHLWGGETAMAESLLRRLSEQNIPARAAIADTFGAAWALARCTRGDIVVSSGDHARRLAPLPIASLRIASDVSDKLRRLGLKTIGHITGLPPASLRKRFGAELRLQLDRALGREDEPVRFRHAPTPWIEQRVFAEGLARTEDLQCVVRDLAEALCKRLRQEGLGGRRFTVFLHRIDGASVKRTIGTALPAQDAKRLAALFAPKIETVDPGFGVESMVLSAGAVGPLQNVQADLENVSAAACPELAPLVDRLRNRLGSDRVWRAAPQESHAPERASTRIAALSPPAKNGWDPEKPRPIRLFQRPEPIIAVAPVPDDPPIYFRWRGRTHRIRRAEGPERIAAEWWRKPWQDNEVDRLRDYYRVEDENGARFWVFRTGLYGAERPTKWWIHGLFA